MSRQDSRAAEVLMEWVRDRAAKRQFEVFVTGATDILFRTGYLMTADISEAEDLVQETLMQVARRWNRVRSMDHPVAYARRILINLVLDGAERRLLRRAELGPQGWGIEFADDSASRALGGIDDLAEFRWALAELPPRQRAVLVLRYWSGLPVAEVAQILGCSAGTVKSQASRGAARLARVPHPHRAALGRARRLNNHQRRLLMMTDELENELRAAFARSAADIPVPEQVRTRLRERDYPLGRVNRGLAAGVTAVAVATGVAVPLAVGAGSPSAAAGSTVMLASYTFDLPAGYTATAAPAAICPPPPLLVTNGSGQENPKYGARLKFAASSSGGCLSLMIESAKSESTAPVPGAPPGARRVHVDQYRAVIAIVGYAVSPRTRGRMVPEWELYVRLPAPRGEVRELAVAESGLSPSALIRIVVHGLQPRHR
jgi:RNA polymerase sigma-70 factor (sigma-E family)